MTIRKSIFTVLLATFFLLFQTALAQDDNPFEVFRDSFTVDFGDFEANAQITYPANGAGPFPTVILIHGSGPADMNNTIVYFAAERLILSENFLDIASYLPTHGFAVVRYNKHYIYNATGSGIMAVEYSRLTLQQMLADAETVLEAAKADPRVDTEQIFVYGWSEGSTIAAALAVEHPEIAGLIVQGPVALPWGATLRQQITNVGIPYLRLFAPEGMITNATLEQALENDGGIVAKNIIGLIADTSVPRRGPQINVRLDSNRDNAISIDDELLPAIGGLFETAFAPDGAFDLYAPNNGLPTLIEQVPNLTLPVLILQGENDASTPLEGAIELEAEFEAADHPDYQLNIYTGLGHSLGAASHVMTDNFLPIAPQPLADLAAWLTAHSELR